MGDLTDGLVSILDDISLLKNKGVIFIEHLLKLSVESHNVFLKTIRYMIFGDCLFLYS